MKSETMAHAALRALLATDTKPTEDTTSEVTVYKTSAVGQTTLLVDDDLPTKAEARARRAAALQAALPFDLLSGLHFPKVHIVDPASPAIAAAEAKRLRRQARNLKNLK